MRVEFFCIVLVASSAVATGCAHAPPPTVQRVNANEQIDLSGKWNDTDANLVAQEMIKDSLTRPWSERFRAKAGRDPVVKLYPIKNRTDEHINSMFFTKQVERQLLNSGMVRVVAAYNETDDVHDERAYQGKHASSETKKEEQNETGTDFVLNGWIILENDPGANGQEVRAFLVTMELTHAESAEKVWIGEKKIKKVVTQQATSW